jgi:hypothetical protein
MNIHSVYGQARLFAIGNLGIQAMSASEQESLVAEHPASSIGIKVLIMGD